MEMHIKIITVNTYQSIKSTKLLTQPNSQSDVGRVYTCQPVSGSGKHCMNTWWEREHLNTCVVLCCHVCVFVSCFCFFVECHMFLCLCTLRVRLFVCLFVCLFDLFVCLFACLSDWMYACLCMYVSMWVGLCVFNVCMYDMYGYM